MRLSEHFSLSELAVSETAARKCIDNTPTPETTCRLLHLCTNTLEPIRNLFGPVIVTSGYRSKELNQSIGGSPNSQHCHGEAADIILPHQDNLFQVAQLIANSGIEFDQLIYEFDKWIHVSHTERTKNRREVLSAYKDEFGHTQYAMGLHR